MGAINGLLNRIPMLLIGIAYCGWMAYGYYDWLNNPASELGQHRNQYTQSKQTLEKTKAKFKEAEEFAKNYEIQKARVRQLFDQLENAKGMLNAEVDVPGFLRMISLEAKKLGLVIKKLRPDAEVKREFYTEVPFTLEFNSAYVQLLVFFDKIARFQQIVRVDVFNMKPSGSNQTKYVELAGNVKLVTYKYTGTEADEVLKKKEMTENVPTGPKSKDTKDGKEGGE